MAGDVTSKGTFMFEKSLVPEVIFDERPDFVKLYYKAWEQAAAHIKTVPGLPVERYMDEACMPGRLWIWDTCFMVHFCKYSPDFFPGIHSLDNFYMPMYDRAPSPCKIHHMDNPPLFAWVEYEYYRFTGDKSRIYRNLVEKCYLQKHFEFLEKECRFGYDSPLTGSIAMWQKFDAGYAWAGCPSGMDNTPRSRGNYQRILWVDALAQMALSAKYIAKLAREINETAIAAEYEQKYEEKSALLNKYYFDETDGCYYDIGIKFHEFWKVLTPASFWVLLAEAATKERAARQISTIYDPNLLGGMVPLPTVARNDRDFTSDGCYWNGSVWLPTTYMTAKALEKYGEFDLASDIAYLTVNHMVKTYENFLPHTIWECYSPTAFEPAKNKNGKYVRKDFCGWSALGPISLFIENIIGLHRADAVAGKVEFHPRKNSSLRYGIRNFKFGNISCDIIVENGVLNCRSNAPFTLEIDSVSHRIRCGETQIKL